MQPIELQNMSPVVADPGGSSGGSGTPLGGILGALAMAYGVYQGSRNQDKQNRANRELAQYQYDRELDMWNRMNEYNSPLSQMGRYQAAGLNPNLIYGSGSASAGNATQLPKYQAPQLSYNFNPAEQIMNSISQYQDFQVRQAQIDNVKAQTENTRARTVSEGYVPELKKLGIDTGKFDLGRRAQLAPYQLESQKSATKSAKYQVYQGLIKTRTMGLQEQEAYLRNSYLANKVDQQQIDKELKEARLLFEKYRNDWTKMGITSSDNIFLRMLVRMGNEAGFSSFESLNPFK